MPILEDRQKSKENGLVYDTVAELFTGKFADSRIFEVVYRSNLDYSHGPGVFPRIFVLNSRTGKRVRPTSLKQFNDWINTSGKKIVALDKAYLYLFVYIDLLNERHYNISSPSAFANVLTDKSEFAQNPGAAKLFEKTGVASEHVISIAAMETSMAQSTERDITLYSYTVKKKPYLCRYHFTFDNNGDMEMPNVVMFQ